MAPPAQHTYDLVIVGMGSGGMPAAEFAASLDLSVAVIERDRVGGDCLWTGCVPSKALLASAKVAHHIRTAANFGLPDIEMPPIDTKPVWARLKAVQQRIAASDDDPARFESLGLDIHRGSGRLVDGTTVEVTPADGPAYDVKGRYVLIATGSRPATIDLPGLEAAGYHCFHLNFRRNQHRVDHQRRDRLPIHDDAIADCLREAIDARERDFVLRLARHRVNVNALRWIDRRALFVRFERDYLERHAEHFRDFLAESPIFIDVEIGTAQTATDDLLAQQLRRLREWCVQDRLGNLDAVHVRYPGSWSLRAVNDGWERSGANIRKISCAVLYVSSRPTVEESHRGKGSACQRTD